MKYEHHHESKVEEPCETAAVPKVEEYPAVEASDRGLFGFGGKKEEKKCEEEVMIADEFEHKVQVCPEKKEYVEEEKKHEGLIEKLRRSDSSSSSVSLNLKLPSALCYADFVRTQ